MIALGVLLVALALVLLAWLLGAFRNGGWR